MKIFQKHKMKKMMNILEKIIILNIKKKNMVFIIVMILITMEEETRKLI